MPDSLAPRLREALDREDQAAASCPWCRCIGYHAEVCEGFAANDPGGRSEHLPTGGASGEVGPVHLLHSEEFGHRVAVCGAVEQSFAGERLNFTVDPGDVECARCIESDVLPTGGAEHA